MMRNICKYAVLAGLVLAAVSCTDYLDIKPYGKTIPQTPEEYSALLQTRLYEIEEGEHRGCQLCRGSGVLCR